MLYLAGVRIERRAKSIGAAQQLLARGFQDCPSSGVLWAHAIATAPRAARKTKSFDALKRCERDPHVCFSVAKLFWTQRKLKKARDWFNRAVLFEPDLGDAWGYYYKFELSLGKKSTQRQLAKRVQEADPGHGELWEKVSKEDSNIGLKAVDILKKVADMIDGNDPFAIA